MHNNHAVRWLGRRVLPRHFLLRLSRSSNAEPAGQVTEGEGWRVERGESLVAYRVRRTAVVSSDLHRSKAPAEAKGGDAHAVLLLDNREAGLRLFRCDLRHELVHAWILPANGSDSDEASCHVTCAVRLRDTAGVPMLHVLLVEDNDDHRELVATALRSDGHRVVEAVTGVEGLQRFNVLLSAGMGPDIIITDLWLPGMLGLSLAACIRSAGCTSPVLLITAHDHHEIYVQARALDVDVVPKPFDIDDLRRRVSLFDTSDGLSGTADAEPAQQLAQGGRGRIER